MNIFIELTIFLIIAGAAIFFIAIQIKSAFDSGYYQGRLDEHKYQEEELKRLLESLANSAIIRRSDLETEIKLDRNLGITEATEYLNVSASTLRRWEKKGIIVPQRTPTGIRMYKKSELDALLARGGELENGNSQQYNSRI